MKSPEKLNTITGFSNRDDIIAKISQQYSLCIACSRTSYDETNYQFNVSLGELDVAPLQLYKSSIFCSIYEYDNNNSALSASGYMIKRQDPEHDSFALTNCINSGLAIDWNITQNTNRLTVSGSLNASTTFALIGLYKAPTIISQYIQNDPSLWYPQLQGGGFYDEHEGHLLINPTGYLSGQYLDTSKLYVPTIHIDKYFINGQQPNSSTDVWDRMIDKITGTHIGGLTGSTRVHAWTPGKLKTTEGQQLFYNTLNSIGYSKNNGLTFMVEPSGSYYKIYNTNAQIVQSFPAPENYYCAGFEDIDGEYLFLNTNETTTYLTHGTTVLYTWSGETKGIDLTDIDNHPAALIKIGNSYYLDIIDEKNGISSIDNRYDCTDIKTNIEQNVTYYSGLTEYNCQLWSATYKSISYDNGELFIAVESTPISATLGNLSGVMNDAKRLNFVTRFIKEGNLYAATSFHPLDEYDIFGIDYHSRRLVVAGNTSGSPATLATYCWSIEPALMKQCSNITGTKYINIKEDLYDDRFTILYGNSYKSGTCIYGYGPVTYRWDNALTIDNGSVIFSYPITTPIFYDNMDPLPIEIDINPLGAGRSTFYLEGYEYNIEPINIVIYDNVEMRNQINDFIVAGEIMSDSKFIKDQPFTIEIYEISYSSQYIYTLRSFTENRRKYTTDEWGRFYSNITTSINSASHILACVKCGKKKSYKILVGTITTNQLWSSINSWIESI